MEELLDQADALVHLAATTVDQPLPDFPIPESLSTIVASSELALKDDPWKGRKWFATTDIPIGRLVLIAKPIAKVMDWQEYDEGEGDSEGEDGDDVEPLMNELLLIETLQAIIRNPCIWHAQLSTLFPRNDSDLSTLPAWVCHNDDVFIQVEALLSQLEELNKTMHPPLLPVKDIATRLPLIVRYNVLSMETCAELLSYPSPNIGHSSLAGIGLYHEPSFFNHSKKPNINRWCIGDVMGFVTNQAIMAGSELCISYIEHDVLCEPSYRRNMMLSMDFLDTDDGDDNHIHTTTATSSDTKNITIGNNDDDNNIDDEGVATSLGPLHNGTDGLQHHSPPPNSGPEAPVVDSDVQNELMAMDPVDRLTAIEELMLQAKGLKLPTDMTGSSDDNEDQPLHYSNSNFNFNESGSTMDMTESLPSDNNDATGSNHIVATPWFQCDIHNLRILKAITYDGLDMSIEAYKEWNDSIEFVQTYLPPHDESSVVLHVQASLCAYHCFCKEDHHQQNESDDGNSSMLTIAKNHAKQAEQTHDILFGGGKSLLRRRFKNEWPLTLRPTTSSDSSANCPLDVLWPLR